MAVIFINLLVIALISYLLFQNSRKNNIPLLRFYFPALGLKLAAGIAVGLVYKYYYGGGDTFNYFHDAVLISDFAWQNPIGYLVFLFETDIPDPLQGLLIFAGQPRAMVTSKILSLFTLVTHDNYWISSLYFSVFSFGGMWFLANILAEKFPSTDRAALLGFLFFPSVIFWSSGILKESLIMGGIGFLLGLTIEIAYGNKKKMWRTGICVLLLILLLWQLKYYFLVVFLSVALTTIILLFLIQKLHLHHVNTMQLILSWFIIFSLLLGASTFLYPTLRISSFFFFLVDSHDIIYGNSATENLIHYKNLTADFVGVFRNLPQALFSGLYRPAIWDIASYFHIIPAIENLFILISTAFFLSNYRKHISTSQKALLVSVVVYIIILAVFMAIASPNLGTLSRYKIGYLPFLVYLVCIKNPLIYYFEKTRT